MPHPLRFCPKAPRCAAPALIALLAAAAGAGWVKSDGTIEIGAWDQRTGRVETHALHPQFERDDHDAPALLLLPDGRVAAFYSLHARGDMRLRVTMKPADISGWAPERELGFNAPERGQRGTTYANPVLLTGEANAIYLFWRGPDFKPTFAVSRDLGATWSPPRTLISRPGADDTNRPYLKLCSDGAGRIDFVFTDGHPRNEPTNSVFHMRYERGAFWRADGTRLATIDQLPIDPARCDRVYDGATLGRAWIWDIATLRDGAPVIAYTRLPSETDHRYAFARWSDTQWLTTEICRAGGWFPQTPVGKTEPEPHYSGGMSLDPRDPFTVYLARRTDGVFEIERWHSSNEGRTWNGVPVTAHSTRDNVRPAVVRGERSDGPTLLWMSNERYVHYTDFRSAIEATTAPGGR